MLSSFVSFLNRFGFGHVFPFFRSAVETRAFWYTCVSVLTQTLPWPPLGAGVRGGFG